MKAMLSMIVGGLLIGALAATHAELPPPTPEEKAAKAAKAEKDAAEKAKAAKQLAGAQDKAVANYKKNQAAAGKRPAGASSTGASTSAAPPAGASRPVAGADHAADSAVPQHEPTKQEEATRMPLPAQANDHSSTGRETAPSSSGGAPASSGPSSDPQRK